MKTLSPNRKALALALLPLLLTACGGGGGDCRAVCRISGAEASRPEMTRPASSLLLLNTPCRHRIAGR